MLFNACCYFNKYSEKKKSNAFGFVFLFFIFHDFQLLFNIIIIVKLILLFIAATSNEIKKYKKYNNNSN